MANLNKVMLIGRLTADPEVRSFANGGKVAKIRFAVSNRKKNAQTGKWDDVPMYIDCDIFNRGERGNMADLAEKYLTKGKQVFFEGRLELETWEDKTSGQKRSKHKLLVESMQFLDGRPADGEGGGGYSGRAENAGGSRPVSRASSKPTYYPDDADGEDSSNGRDSEGDGGDGGEIPF